ASVTVTTRVLPGGGTSNHAWLTTGAVLVSDAFVVGDAIDQLALDVGYLTTGSTVVVEFLSGASFATTTGLGTFGCSGGTCGTWQPASMRIDGWRGQTVELQLRATAGEIGVDTIRGQAIFPNHTIGGNIWIGTEAGNTYAGLGSGGVITTNPLTVTADIQQ